MKRLLLLTVVVCLAELGFSQTDFRKGYVITNQRDTLFGLVDYRTGDRAHRSCDFKSTKDQNATTYEPVNLAGYGFENDKFFQSREILIKDQPPKVVFLEVIVRGLASLYLYEETFFIEKGDGGLQQLLNETKEIFVDGKRLLKPSNQHIGTINMLLFDCAEIRAKAQRINLEERPMTTLIEDYNRCMGSPNISFKAKKPWTKAIAGITGGINISELSFEAYNGYEHLKGVFEVSKSPMIGISLDVLSPRLSERVAFHTDILYLTSKYYNYNQFKIGAATVTNYVTLELQQLKIPIGFRYTFPKRNFTPYFNLGLSSTIHLSSKTHWIQDLESNNVVQTFTREALTLNSNQIGYWGGLGILKSINNKLDAFIELRFEKTNGVSRISVNPVADPQSRVTNFQITFGVRTR